MADLKGPDAMLGEVRSSGRLSPTGSGDIEEEHVPTQHDGKSPAMPSINERLSHLRPSRELLEYYRFVMFLVRF